MTLSAWLCGRQADADGDDLRAAASMAEREGEVLLALRILRALGDAGYWSCEDECMAHRLIDRVH